MRKLYLIILCLMFLAVTLRPTKASAPCPDPKTHQEYTHSCLAGALEMVLYNLGIDVTERQLIDDYMDWHTDYMEDYPYPIEGEPCPTAYEDAPHGVGLGGFGEALIAYTNYTYDVHLENLMYYTDTVDLDARPPVTKVPNPGWLDDLRAHPEWEGCALIVYQGHCYVYQGYHSNVGIVAHNVSYAPGAEQLRTHDTPTAIFVPTTGQYEDYSWAALMWGPKLFLGPIFRNYTQ